MIIDSVFTADIHYHCIPPRPLGSKQKPFKCYGVKVDSFAF